MRISIKAMLTLCYLCFARKVAIEQNEKEYLCIIVDTPENELLADFKRICGENIIKLMEPKKLVKKANFAACVNTKKENLKTMVFDNENVHNLCRYFIENAYNQMLKYFEFESQEQTNKKSSAENENCSIPVSILEASKVFLSNSDQKMQVFTNMKFEEIFKPVSGLEEFLKEAYWEILNISCEKDYLKNLFFLSSLIKTPFSEETILEFYKYNENKSLCIQHIEEDFFYDIKNIYNLFRGLFESSFDINTSVKKIILLLSPQKHFLNHIFQTCWDEINQINFDSVTMENINETAPFLDKCMDNLKNQNFTIPENNTKNYLDPENIIVEYHFIETFDYHSFLKNFYAKKNTINSLDHIVSIENFMLWYLKMQITPIYTDLHNRIAKVFFLLFPEKNIIFQFAVDPFANPTDMKKSKASNEKKDQTIMTDSKEGNAKADTIITNDSIAANDQIKQNDTLQTVQEKAEGQKPKKKRKKYTENKAVQRETVESAQNTVEVVNVESSKDFEKDPDSMVDSVKDKNETVETPNMSVSESTKNTPDQIIVQNDDSKLPKEKKRNKPDITKDTKNKNKNYKLILRLFISGDPYKCQEFLNNSDDKLRGLDSKFVRHINIPERHPNTEKLKVYTGIIDAFKKEVATNNIKKSQPETEDRKQLL